MKKLSKFIAVVALTTFAFGCGPSEDDIIEQVRPIISAQTLTSGTVEVEVEPFDVHIVFDRAVVVKDAQKVQLEPHAAFEVSTINTGLTISLKEELEYETDYVLTIGEGAVADKLTGGLNYERVITFRTVNAPYVPPTEPTMALVNPDAITPAKNLYTYLWITHGKGILSGAMANVAWNISECEWVKKWTGKYPAIATFDYIHLPFSPANWIDYTNISVVEKWWNDGGIVAAGWHWMVPERRGVNSYTYEPSKTTVRVKNMLTEGTWENELMWADLEKMADMLMLLQEAEIPVLWRPLHEAAGNIYAFEGGKAWFWWGYDGAEAYKQLWRTMFDYFKQRGLNNLIWVWTTQTNDIEFYPGDEYVDIIGCDIYNRKSASSILSQWEHMDSQFPHKILTLSEMGNVAPISSQLDAGAYWSYFMPWYDHSNDYSQNYNHQHANIAWWSDAMTDERVISRDELPNLRLGILSVEAE